MQNKKALTEDEEIRLEWSRIPQFYYNYGNLLKKNGDSKSAIEKYLTAIDMDPENDSFYTNIGIAYMDLEDYAKAKEYFLKGLKIAPDDYELNADMSEISFNHDKDYQATVDYSTKALKVIYGGKDKAQLLDIRGDARLMLGDYQSALQDYLEIINRFSEEEKSVNGSSYANVGYCYLGMKNYSLAKKYFDISLGYQTQIDPLIGLMIMYYEQGDKENLKKTKSMAIKVEPALKKGMEGMKKIEADGYFYSAEQKDVLKAIFGK